MRKILETRINPSKRFYPKSSKSEVVKPQTNITKDIPEDRRYYLPNGKYLDQNDPLVIFYLSKIRNLI